MDPSWKSSLYLKDHWIKRLLEDYEEEVDNASTWAVKLVAREVRVAVWNTCRGCGVDAKGGLPGHACLLLERYLSASIREKATTVTNNAEWKAYKDELGMRMPLVIASCVQLAAKMTSATIPVHPNVIRASLMRNGIVYSTVDIIASEFQVFSAIGCRVPLWTSVEAAQLMAVEVGLPGHMMDRVEVVVNIAEYRRDCITERACQMATRNSPSTFNTATLFTLHLAAGAVAAAARYLDFVGPDPSPRLAALTRAPLRYLVLICDIILADILHDSDTESDSDSRQEPCPLGIKRFKRSY